MLTDYHVHLRPDEPENAERYQEVASERGIGALSVFDRRRRTLEPIG